MQSRVRKLTKERDNLSDKLTEIIEKVKEHRARRETIERSFKKIREIGINDNDRYIEVIKLIDFVNGDIY